VKRRDLERYLRSQDAELLREGARHSVWAIGGPDSERMAAVPRHREIKPGTVRAICKELEIPPPASTA
jgi:mRNA interferase HicA